MQRRAPWKRSKYGNKRVKVTMGVSYDSKGEAAYAAHLQALKLAKEVADLERQVRIELRAGGKKVCTYVADFIVHRPNGDVEIHEYKGYKTELFSLKWRLLECTINEVRDRMWPGKDVRMELIMHH